METDDERLTAEMERRSRSFDAWARDYDRYRPSYPDSLFDHIAQAARLPLEPTVADLGAGTGKAALAMARRSWRVTAVEPGGAMLDVLVAHALEEELPVDPRLASAEDTGLPDASVDLVTAAQAFHWFDHDRAVPEMARIVRPGGGVAVFWNVAAGDRSDFLAANFDLLARFVPEEHLDRRHPEDETETREKLSAGGWFEVDQRVQLPHSVTMTRDDFIALTFTSSNVRMFVTAADELRLRSELAELLREHAPNGRIEVPYDVDVFVGRREDS